MKMKNMLVALFIVTATVTGFAQTVSFDREIAPWHKKATMQCGMLKASPVDAAQILKNLDELTAGLKALSDKYLDNPPAEYARDPNWKSYFQTFGENIVVVRERVEKKQLKRLQFTVQPSAKPLDRCTKSTAHWILPMWCSRGEWNLKIRPICLRSGILPGRIKI